MFEANHSLCIALARPSTSLFVVREINLIKKGIKHKILKSNR
jgi:hypothetical protein